MGNAHASGRSMEAKERTCRSSSRTNVEECSRVLLDITLRAHMMQANAGEQGPLCSDSC